MSNQPNGTIDRPAAKVLLVNHKREILLFHTGDGRGDGSNREVWFTVGGGVEEGESFVECAVRELWEETGLRMSADELGPAVATRSGAWQFKGQDLWSDEAFFFVTVPEWTVDPHGLTEVELSQGISHRWWPLDELVTMDGTVYPPARELHALVLRILESGLPPEPVRLSWEG
ncbi:MAG: NUDIX domain-containing protein [Nitrolancea sp.]